MRPVSPTLRRVRGHSSEMRPYTTPATPLTVKNTSSGHLATWCEEDIGDGDTIPPAQLGDDDGDGPAGQLHQRPQEVRLVHVTLAQVAGVLHVPVVAHEPHHADKRSGVNFIPKILYYK